MLAIFRSEFLFGAGGGGESAFASCRRLTICCGGGGYARAGGVVLPPGQAAPAQGNARRAPKVSVKPFQRLAESRDRVSGRSRRSETPQDGCGNPRACARSAVPSGRQAAVLNSGFWVGLGAIAVM